MLRKIHINDLLVGMYVEKIDQSWLDHDLLYACKRRIKSKDEIEKFKRSDIEEVYINTDKGSDLPLDRSDSAYKNLLNRISLKTDEIKIEDDSYDLKKELEYAKQIYDDSIKFVKNFIDDARSGKIISYEEAIPFVSDIMKSLSRNKNAMVAMVNLYNFDKYLYTHSLDVAIVSLSLAKHLGVPKRELSYLGLGALFHDIGKAKIPEEILNKPGKLTSQEYEIMKKHPVMGHKLLENQKGIPQEVLQIVVGHHEKYNGQGYPLGLGGKNIDQLANLVSVADIYDALTTDRAYRKSLHPYKALQILFCERDDHFYPGFAENLIKCLGIYPVASLVKLSTGDYGRVVETCADCPLAPKVKLILDEDMQPRPKTLIDLNAFRSIQKQIKVVECLDPYVLPVDIKDMLMRA